MMARLAFTLAAISASVAASALTKDCSLAISFGVGQSHTLPPKSLMRDHQTRILKTEPFSLCVAAIPRMSEALGAENASVEPTTRISFSKRATPPGASSQLSLLGAGVREKSIAFLKVKVYAVAMYVDPSAGFLLNAWKGKDGYDLVKEETFFKTLASLPVGKALEIVLARDIEGAQFWGALDEALTPRLKSSPSGLAALESLGNVFKDCPLKTGTRVYLTWTQPSTLHIAISRGSPTSAPNASIDSKDLLLALFDVYLGKDPVSPSLKKNIASVVAEII